MSTRPTAVSGLFYPEQANMLESEVRDFLAGKTQTVNGQPKAIIVPHAGYIYSGAVAASAYQYVQAFKNSFTKVLLLGPSHRVAFSGIATPGCEYFSSPLGNTKLDVAALHKLEQLPFVERFPQAHAAEHSLEVLLPFLQITLRDFELVPLVVCDASAASVKYVIDTLWHENTLVIVSSDLSHFLDYEHAKAKDRETSHLIETHYAKLEGDQACGCRPINGLLEFCSENKLDVTTIDMCNSGDVTGDRERVVGYGAYVIH